MANSGCGNTNEMKAEIIQENHYYSFGLAMEGPWVNNPAEDNKYPLVQVFHASGNCWFNVSDLNPLFPRL
jgi:hypothetical protein